MPEAYEEQMVHFLSLGLTTNLMQKVTLETYRTVQHLQTKLNALEGAQNLMKKGLCGKITGSSYSL